MYFKIYLVYVPKHIQNFWDYQKPYDEENKQRDYTIFENCFYESNLDNDISSRELRISLNNNLEIKIKDPSQSDKLLKISVIKQLTFKIDYDLDKKEFKWSNIYFNINISFTKNVTTQFRGSITPYKILKSYKPL